MQIKATVRFQLIPVRMVSIKNSATNKCGEKATLLNFWCSVAKSCLILTTWTAPRQSPLSPTVSLSLFKFMSVESVMLSNNLILCHSLFLLPSISSCLHCWWECKLVQALWRTGRIFLKKKLKIELLYSPAIPLLGIYPEKTIFQKIHASQGS